MMYGCYLRKGIVYLTTLGKMNTGGHRDIDPVSVVPVSDTAGLERAFRETIARGNPIVPGPVEATIRSPSY